MAKRNRVPVSPQAKTGAPKPAGMSAKLALMFAKLLSVGCPAFRAVLYCCPDLDMDTAKETARAWMADAVVLKACNDINGGAWMDLPPETRYQLSLDKHYAEMAFHLYASNFSEASSRDDLEKLRQCREVLSVLVGKPVDENDPMTAFARFAIELSKGLAEKDARRKRPMQVQKTSETDLLSQMSVMITETGRKPS